MKIKLFAGPSTRQWSRFHIADVPSLKGIRLVAGDEMEVVNISRGGALLQTRRRLAPGTRIHLDFEIVEGVIQVAGFVLRSAISSAKRIPRYQAAVVFSSPLLIVDAHPRPLDFAASNSPRLGDECAVSAAILAFRILRKSPDPALQAMLSLNRW